MATLSTMARPRTSDRIHGLAPLAVARPFPDTTSSPRNASHLAEGLTKGTAAHGALLKGASRHLVPVGQLPLGTQVIALF